MGVSAAVPRSLESGEARATGPGVGVVGWVRNLHFDLLLIVGVLALALGTAVALALGPRLFLPLLFVDTWALAYQHVVATFTRLTFDTESLRRHWRLTLSLPVVLLPAALGLYLAGGAPALMTVYFYWQWFHYTRQSYGVERLYWRKAGSPPGAALNAGLLYAVAIWGIAARSAQHQPFMTIDLFWLPVPPVAVTALGWLFGALFVAWTATRVRDWWRGTLSLGQTAFMVSHVILFLVGYQLMEDVTYGWLVVNVWHNAQYLLVVWLFNTNRFKTGVDPAHRFLSTLCQPRNVVWYFATLLVIGVAFYYPLGEVARWLALGGWAAGPVLSQAINFHHYAADAFIWKLRQQPVRAQFGITG